MRRFRSALASLAARARDSSWTRPVLKGAAILVALLVLAHLGRRSPEPAAIAAPNAAPPSASPAPIASLAPPLAPTATSPPPASESAPVYLNTATMDDLRRLPGIGQKRARAILDLRARQGRFRQIEDLLKVRGIGRATLKRIMPLVKLDPPAPQGTATGKSDAG